MPAKGFLWVEVIVELHPSTDNRLTIKREDFEARVLTGLKDQLLHPDLIAEYVRAY